MKKLNNKSFPYPVLGRRNNVAGSYYAQVTVSILKNEASGDVYTFTIEHSVDEDVIATLIRSGEARYCVDVECPSTIFRETFTSKDTLQEIKISANDLSEEVSVNAYVVATREIKGYKSPNFDKAYGDNVFDLDVGDILAFSEKTTIFWSEKVFQSTKLIKNFFVVRPNPNKELVGPINIVPQEDKIVIYLSIKDYEKFQFYKTVPFVPEILHSSLVFPVLNQVLCQIASSNEEYLDFLWFRMLKHKIKRHENLARYYNSETDTLLMTVNDVPEVTQIILKYPFSRQLIGIECIKPRTVEGEDETI